MWNIPQQGTTQQLDSLADRLMFGLSYRNFGSYASLLVNHSVAANSATASGGMNFGIPAPDPPSTSRARSLPTAITGGWEESQDKLGNIAVGYSVSSFTVDPLINIASRAPSDALGVLSSETNIVASTGFQNGRSRWGDYSTASVDPVDDCTIWYTNEYLTTSGDTIWSTHINHFKLGSCQ
jgi:hypothetical protein